MAVFLSVSPPPPIELPDLVARVERTLDPRSDETLLALAGDLAALGANPTFLAEHIARGLAAPATFQAGTAYGSGRSFVLAAGRTFVIRANLWDPLAADPWGEHHAAPVRKQVAMYGLLHDHDFSFLTVGYFGPGYRTALYECDPGRIEGYVGERVALLPLGERTLARGAMLYFARRRHVHAQGTPEAPSVSINLIALDPETPFVSQHYFDDATSEIVARTSDPFNGRLLLCDVAAALGDGRVHEPLAALAHAHPSAALRVHATRALAELEQDDGRAVWRRALSDPHPLVQRAAREALAEAVTVREA